MDEEGRSRREHAIDDPTDGGGRSRREHVIESNAGAIADDCMDAGARAMQEQLPTTAWMQELEQCRSNCRVHTLPT
jgi:hypothetical protein